MEGEKRIFPRNVSSMEFIEVPLHSSAKLVFSMAFDMARARGAQWPMSWVGSRSTDIFLCIRRPDVWGMARIVRTMGYTRVYEGEIVEIKYIGYHVNEEISGVNLRGT